MFNELINAIYKTKTSNILLAIYCSIFLMGEISQKAFSVSKPEKISQKESSDDMDDSGLLLKKSCDGGEVKSCSNLTVVEARGLPQEGAETLDIVQTIAGLTSKDKTERINAGQILWFEKQPIEVIGALEKVLDSAKDDYLNVLVASLIEQGAPIFIDEDFLIKSLSGKNVKERKNALTALFEFNGADRRTVDNLIGDLKAEDSKRLDTLVEIGRRVADYRVGFKNVELYRLIPNALFAM